MNRERWSLMKRDAELPAAAAGDEEADEEVVLRMGIDVLKPEHWCLECETSPVDNSGIVSMDWPTRQRKSTWRLADCSWPTAPAGLLLSATSRRQSCRGK